MRVVPSSGDHRWPRRVLCGALAISLLVNGWLIAADNGPKVGAWRSQSGRATYLSAYDDVLDSMPEHRSWDLDTDYGTVRAYLFTSPEHEGKTPIVLLPGWGSGAPMWKINIAGLVRERPVYALDALGDAGRSSQTVPLTSPEAQAEWIDQSLGGLEIDTAHIVGHSFGGWNAANLAVRRPGRVASLSLFDPVQTFGPIRWQVVLKSIPSTVPLLPQSWRDQALADIGGVDAIDPDDPMTRMISAGTQYYVSQRSFPGRFSDDQLRSLRMPVFAALAGDSAVNAAPEKALTRAESLVPDIEIRVWPGASHSLPMEQPDKINSDLLGFIGRY
jgi:pimeloyl-ACP methyl ester carboxylesterase